jgi:hypothetical protein
MRRVASFKTLFHFIKLFGFLQKTIHLSSPSLASAKPFSIIQPFWEKVSNSIEV